jgi:apyrase
VCATAAADVATRYPDADPEHAAYLCLDVAFIRALLVDGLGVGVNEAVTIVDQIEYDGKGVEAAWALGDAVATLGEGADPDAIFGSKGRRRR